MKIARLISAAAAALTAFTLTLTSVAAEEAEEENTIPFEADGSMVVEGNIPALSFDTESFKDYIHLTRDAEKGGISFAQDRDTYYQGASLKISASTEGVEGYMTGSGMVRDENNELIYPDAPEAEETDKFSIIGIELHAEDFGLSCFDGCTLTYAYRLTEADSTALLDQSVWVYPTDDDYVRLVDNPVKLTVNTTLDDNISQYRKSYVSVGPDVGATKIVFDVPTTGAINGDALYLDNITIKLPETIGEDRYIMNLDGYNKNAEPRETKEQLQIALEGNTLESRSGEKASDKVNPLTFVIIGVAVVIVAVVIVVIVKKVRNRFY